MKKATKSALEDMAIIEADHFQQLLDVLRERGYQVLGPTISNNAIVYGEVTTVADLPVGYTDEQKGATYRLKKRTDGAFFGYSVGPHAWKKFLNPPLVRLWQAKRHSKGMKLSQEQPPTPRMAFIGVRACELRAIAIQDRVFMDGEYVDPIYKQRRKNIFVVAVNCGQAGGTCFCVSMKTGPKATEDFDLALTEILDADRHYFVVEVGSSLGAAVLQQIPHTDASNADLEAAQRVVANAADHMGRTVDTTNIHHLLTSNTENPVWDKVASRCLSCANCTMVCPTCFCTTVEDVTDLKGEHAERWRKWDSCFTVDFSYIHGGSIRASAKSRYRQWLTHKFANWIEQFGTSGCVGCGRCITWCPAAIDVTEEIANIQLSSAAVPVKEN